MNRGLWLRHAGALADHIGARPGAGRGGSRIGVYPAEIRAQFGSNGCNWNLREASLQAMLGAR